MTDRFAAFIEKLAAVEVEPDAFNLYAHGSDANAIRRANLSRFFAQVAEIGPRYMLIGEAPGYQGCRLTGIPFTSEYLMLNGVNVNGQGFFGADAGYRKTDEFERVRKEPSGTILWETVAEIGFVPVIWASFPFHPHKPGKPWSNRAPRTREREVGQPFLEEIMALFPVEIIVAVGNKADDSLTRLGIAHEQVRHPSQGGKNDFVAGMRAIAERLT
ncbi:MAG: uracil-DNA glycosylase [Anaerolineae bacterium]|nr:uracil-DNA glycosylase [Anaerolineae bacterium]